MGLLHLLEIPLETMTPQLSVGWRIGLILVQ
ncbi:hypothetical protein NGRRMQZB_24 [Escherichia phage Dru_SM1]